MKGKFMNGQFVRQFSQSSRALEAYWRSTVNNLNPTIKALPGDFSPKSVVLLSTVNVLPHIIKQAIGLYDQNIQVVVAGIDTVKGSRVGFSELWMDQRMNILSSAPLQQESHEHAHSDGVNIVTLKDKNWKLIDSELNLNFNDGSSPRSVKFSLANSLFDTLQLVTLFQLDPKNNAIHDKSLSKLSVELPKLFETPTSFLEQDLWVPLTENSEPLYITNCVGNLIKSINNKSAAKMLENNHKLMSINSKETKVYVKIYRNSDSKGHVVGPCKVNKHEIIAGGGGWGAKADTIVVAPPAKLAKGDRVEIFMLPPRDLQPTPKQFDQSGFEFECIIPEQSYHQPMGDLKQYDQFAGGSELGFEFNEVNYKSMGERILICK